MTSKSTTWDALIDRYAAFSAMPCLRSNGPHRDRPDRGKTIKRLRRRLEQERRHLPDRPCDLTQRHIAALLKGRGLTTRDEGGRPSDAGLWGGLWRVIILNRDDYRCFFCGRSGEAGITLNGERLALRLELDHVHTRSAGGHDYQIENICTLCRTCNVARGRLLDEHFRVELQSLAHALCRLTPPSAP